MWLLSGLPRIGLVLPDRTIEKTKSTVLSAEKMLYLGIAGPVGIDNSIKLH